MIRGVPALRRSARAGGFSLLEALIALTILGSSAVALLAWVQQSRDTLRRVETVRDEAQLQLDAQAWLEALNPAKQRQGSVELDGLAISWTSEPAAAERDENDFNGNLQPYWRIGLYQLRVKAQRGGVRAQWIQLMTGWRERDGVRLPGVAP